MLSKLWTIGSKYYVFLRVKYLHKWGVKLDTTPVLRWQSVRFYAMYFFLRVYMSWGQTFSAVSENRVGSDFVSPKWCIGDLRKTIQKSDQSRCFNGNPWLKAMLQNRHSLTAWDHGRRNIYIFLPPWWDTGDWAFVIGHIWMLFIKELRSSFRLVSSGVKMGKFLHLNESILIKLHPHI